jgi:glycosyltransferase involved in cell wall biosynthesis
LQEAIELSVVVPVHDEAGNAADLAREIARALEGRSYEMIFVDDSSRDETRAELAGARQGLPGMRIIGHRQNAGQSRAVRSGVMAARASTIATLDGDGQNDPADIPRLLARLNRPDAPAGLGMVSGLRIRRADAANRRMASQWANRFRAWVLGDGAQDSGCGIKVFRKDAFLRLPYFDHMHRYMPALMRREGYGVEFVEVNHRPRKAGRSNYTNTGRFFAAMSDLWGVVWLKSRLRDPGGADEL